MNKENLRDLIAATGLVILLKIGFKSSIFCPRELEIWWMNTKNNGTHLLYYVKLCTSFQSHRWIQTGVTVRKRSIRVTISHILSHVTLKFNGWPCKTIGHLFYATSSFVHHFIAITEFKLKYSPEMPYSDQNQWFFLSCVTLKFDGWTWKTIGHLFYATSSVMHHFIAISEFKLELLSGNTQCGSKLAIFFVPCDLLIWWMTLKNNRTPLLIKIEAICIISLSYVNSNWSYGPETAKLGFDLCDLDLWPWPFAWTSLLSMIITPEIFMMIREHSEKGVTDGRAEGRTDGLNHS